MKVLYVSPAGASRPMMALLARCVYEVHFGNEVEGVRIISSAINTALKYPASIIPSASLGFAAHVMAETLELLETMEKGTDTPHQ